MGGNHSSCVCVHVCGRLKSFVLRLSNCIAFFTQQADDKNWLSSLGGGRKEWCYDAFYNISSFSCVCMDFCLVFHPPLISTRSPPPQPSGLCATFFCMLVRWWYKRDCGASPHNSLSERHPPVHSRLSSQTLPASDSAVAEASNQQWLFAPLDVPP